MDGLVPENLSRPILWGVPLWQFAAAALIIFVGLVSRRLITWTFSGVLKR